MQSYSTVLGRVLGIRCWTRDRTLCTKSGKTLDPVSAKSDMTLDAVSTKADTTLDTLVQEMGKCNQVAA